MRHRFWLGVFALVGSSVPQLTSCASRPETIGSSSEGVVTAATVNYNVGGSSFVMQSETSVAFASGVSNPVNPGRWVVGFNTGNGNTLEAGWAYSSDGTGTSWTAQGIGGIHDWGDPGNSPFDGSPFAGWRSDPSLAVVTDPALSEGNVRVMYTNVACTNGCAQDNDVVIALSRDGGVTWNNAAYVNGDSSHGGGGGIDNPWIATNPVSPYHSFVGWTNNNGAWLARVEYSNPSDGAAITFSATNYTQPPAPSGQTILHPRIAVGQYTDCSSNLHEAVFYAFATNFGRCAFDGTQHNGSQGYYLDLYDVPSNTWHGPFTLRTTGSWPNCVGGGTGTLCFPGDGGPGAPYCADNDPRPHVAVDYNSTNGKYFVTFPFPSAHGTRINVATGSFGCSGNSTKPTNHTDPDPCDPGPSGCTNTGPDGGPYIHDEWGPDVAFTYRGGTPRAVVTYYGTRGDTANVGTNMYMYYTENYGLSWSTPVAIAMPNLGQTVPWDYHLGDWSDYQALAPDFDGGLLGAWGGDCRNGVGLCNMFSTTFQ